MTCMTRRAGRMTMCAGLAFGLVAAAASAMPAVVDRVPEGAGLVVVVPTPAKVTEHVQALATAAEFPLPPMTFEDLMMHGAPTTSLDTAKPFGLFIMPDELNKEFGDPVPVILVPVKDYKQFIADMREFGGTTEADSHDGVDEIMLDYETMYSKDVGGGYAALSPEADKLALVVAEGGKGATAAFKEAARKSGNELSDSADVAFIFNVEPMRDAMRDALKEMREEIAASMPADAEANPFTGPLGDWLSETFVRDSRLVVAGLTLGASGVKGDAFLSFNDGSYLAKACATGGDSTSLLSRLPVQPYLFAMAADTSSQGCKQLLRDYLTKMQASMPADAAAMFPKEFADIDGYAAVVGSSPAAFMGGGLFTNTLAFTKTDNPEKIKDLCKSAIEAGNGKTINGMTYTTTYAAAATEVNGVKADEWSMKIAADPNDATGMGAQQMQAMAIFFGPAGGPAGYMAATKDGVYTTYGKNTLLLGAALDTAGKDGNTLAKDTVLKQIGDELPKHRVAEVYLGTKSIMEMVGPFMGMMGVQVDPAQIAGLPPVGMGVATDDGAAHAGLFIPAPVIRVGAGIGMDMQQQMMGGPGMGGMDDQQDWGDENPDENDDDGTGQPQF